MYSTISAKLLLVVGVAILLTGQMSHCDTGSPTGNNTAKAKANASSPAQSSAAEAPKKSPGPVNIEVIEKAPEPVIDQAPARDAAPVAPVAAAPAAAEPVPPIANVKVGGNLLSNQTEIPGTIQTAFYVFVALGLVVIFYISYRSYRLRSSRAARRYGTRGNHSRHELQPLPSAIELDSEDEESTVFDRINNKN